ncbi:hypothetical protein LCGC14_0827960 [marine sediment metagenome]|uniref:Uncharacterized protein n=1 Tax=marine sediment metagenome TaxID=412755 RepID=A0A0F9S1P1_9ZZZZ
MTNSCKYEVFGDPLARQHQRLWRQVTASADRLPYRRLVQRWTDVEEQLMQPVRQHSIGSAVLNPWDQPGMLIY